MLAPLINAVPLPFWDNRMATDVNGYDAWYREFHFVTLYFSARRCVVLSLAEANSLCPQIISLEAPLT